MTLVSRASGRPDTSASRWKAALFASIAGLGALAATSAQASSPAAAATVAATDAAAVADAATPGSGAVTAATPAGDAVEAAVGEVIVTARRTQERAIDVPIPLSVLSGGDLQKQGGYTLVDIQNHVPNLVAYNANPRNSSIGIRGIGVSSAADGLDTSVGVYVDGVYLGRPGMALGDLIDVGQVEVLRGPQGTLFGRNSSAGVLNITTLAPSFTPGGSFEAQLGDYSYRQFRGTVTGPLVDDLLAGRLTLYRTDRDGWLDNRTTHIRANSVGRFGARGQLLFTPTSKLSVKLIAEYSDEDDTCCVSVLNSVFSPTLSATTARTLAALKALGYTPQATREFTLNNAPQNMRTDQKAVSTTVNWDLDWADFTSISAWRYWHFNPLQDSDNLPLDIIQKAAAITRDWQLSQELRLASKPGRFTWQTGVYVFHQKLKDHYVFDQFGTDAAAFYTTYARLANPAAAAAVVTPGSQYNGDTQVHTDSAAIFAQANYKVTDRLTLTGGVRYTHDERHGTTVTSNYLTPYASVSPQFAYDVTVKGDNVSYLGSATYRVTNHVNVYGSYSTGYKEAGLNLNAPVTTGTPLVLQPEKVKDGELGVKSSLFDGSVAVNANLFWTTLTGLQANYTPANGARTYLANVGNIRARGVEADATWRPTDQLTLSTNGSYNDAVYTSYPNAPCPAGVTGVCDLTGRPVFAAPRWVANAIVRYETDLGDKVKPFAQADYAFRSAQFGSADDAAYARIKAYALVNFRVGARFNEHYEATLWIQNAFDKQYFQTLSTATLVGAAAFGTVGQLGTPRTWGVTLHADF